MPILNRDDAAEVRDSFDQFFEAEADERPGILRGLFAEILDFERVDSRLALAPARERAGIELPDAAERIAHFNGVNVLYVALSDTERVRKSEVVAVAKQVRDDLGEDMLLLFSNAPTSQLHWIYPDFGSGANPTLKRMVVERDLPRRTVVQQISNIYWRYGELGNVLESIKEAFDVEPVTKEFFKQYKTLFEAAEEKIEGFATTDQGHEERKQFVQTLFNRLMFVYFLSRKGWLKYEGETDYLNALWDAYGEHTNHDNFYRDRLTFLFFQGLNNPDSRDVRRGVDFLIGDVPFLNGGLFEESELDQLDGVHVPDDAVRPLMTELFDKFNFTVMESTPFDIEVAVDPEMLGKVFEELVTGRHASGAYYTPRPVVSFMCREALIGYLGSHAPEVGEEALRRLVEDDDASQVSRAAAPAIGAALDSVTVVDPACGSGAYLVGMMQELLELYGALYSERLLDDPKSLYELKLHIIERNLHGVDLDPFAVNIAMLRLWLSLAIEFEGDRPKPLPNLDFKIVGGDSLLGPDPSETGQQGVLGYDGNAVNELRILKSRYMSETDPKGKKRLSYRIDKAEEAIRDNLSQFSWAENALDWRIDFAEVIADGGFDIAIANPPYIQLQSNRGRLGNLYKDRGFETFARTGDIYQLFYERGCQLLQRSGGLIAYITSNSWLRAEYGKKTRQYFADHHTPLRWLDLGKDVFDSAIVDSGVLMLRTGGSAVPFPSVDMDAIEDTEIPPAQEHWGESRPEGNMPWSVLSQLEWSVMDKMRSKGTPLKEWDIAIYRGVTTGLNEAFIIDNETKDALIVEDPRSAEIIKPVLRGRDIRRYRADWRGLWLIATLPALDLSIDNYPAVKAHLLSYGRQRLEQSGKRLADGTRARKKSGNAWFELQDTCAYHADFDKKKLLWIELVERGRFAYDEMGLYPEATTFLMTGTALKFLCAVLNSALVSWYLRQAAPTSGMGTLRWKKVYVETIPVPLLDDEERRPLVNLLDRIIEAQAVDTAADTSAWERTIDSLVSDLYGLTDAEVGATIGGESAIQLS